MASSAVYLDGKVDPDNVTTNTFTGVNFGTAASDRRIAVFIGARPNVLATATVTIGGVTATLREDVAWTGSGATQLLLYVADVPTGTSGTIEIAWSTTNNRCGIEVYGLYGVASGAPAVTSERDTDGTFGSFTLSAASHVIGSVFSIASTNRTARISGAHSDLSAGSPTISYTSAETNISWTGLTEDHDATVEVLGGTGFLGSPGIIAAWATVADSGINGTASGSIALSGASAGTVLVSGSASGALALTGSSAGTVEVQGAASGTISLTGAASGTVGLVGAATGSIALTGAASGTVTIAGEAAGDLEIAGSATGAVAILGEASGTIALAGSATASDEAVVTGTASGVIALTGIAQGTVGSRRRPTAARTYRATASTRVVAPTRTRVPQVSRGIR